MLKSKYLFLSLLFFVFATSCKRQKIHKQEIVKNEAAKVDTVKVIAEKPVEKVDSSAIIKAQEKQLIAENFKYKDTNFDYLNLKTKVDFLLAGDSQSFPASIHIKKDSAIWISVAIGLEAARGIITQDSIMFLDRLHRTYYKFSFVELSKQFNFDLNFKLVQAIIIGNMPISLREGDEINKKEADFVVSQLENRIAVNSFISILTNKLNKVEANDTSGNSKLLINYDDFSIINQEVIPKKVSANIEAKKNEKVINTSVKFEHTRVDFLTQNPGFPFSIPKTYQRAEIGGK